MNKPVSQVFNRYKNYSKEAVNHFQEKLNFETDIADLAYDQANNLVSYIIMDVRSAEDYEKAHIPSAISVPGGIVSTKTELDLSIPIVVYCWGPACNGATKAAWRLSKKGFIVKELLGGIEYWRKEGGELEGELKSESPVYWSMEGLAKN